MQDALGPLQHGLRGRGGGGQGELEGLPPQGVLLLGLLPLHPLLHLHFLHYPGQAKRLLFQKRWATMQDDCSGHHEPNPSWILFCKVGNR